LETPNRHEIDLSTPFVKTKNVLMLNFVAVFFVAFNITNLCANGSAGGGALAALDWGRRASLGPGSGGGRSGSATIGLGNDGLQSRPTSSRRELDVYLFTCLKWLLVLVSSCFRRH
jgi:hypothetical protein